MNSTRLRVLKLAAPLGVAAAVMLIAGGCAGDAAANAAQATGQGKGSDSARQMTFILHPDHIPAGTTVAQAGISLRNPYEGDRAAVADGGKLFIGYNCVDCHGADGSGAMGPSFQDGRWHFGGTPGEVFQSIYEGRPDGMPSWGGRLDDRQIWKLVAYVRSLQAGRDVSTENFTGKTVERTGH